MSTYLPVSSYGVGLRSQHVNDIMQTLPQVGWFELLTDNHLMKGGRAKAEAFAIREHYPVSLHCVNMSLGSTDPLNWDYFKQIKHFANDINPWIISDHLCWTSVHGQYSHELLPLPYNDETVKHVSERISQVQDYLGRRIAIENVSTYLNFKQATLNESAFLAEVAEEADCNILFDVNNVYVSHCNTGENINAYLNNMPWHRVVEIHLAGFETREIEGQKVLLDTHSQPVYQAVWQIYDQVLKQAGAIPTLIEWDNQTPDWSTLFAEMKKISQAQNEFAA